MTRHATTRALQQSATTTTPAPRGILQRKCGCGTYTVAGGECESCGKEKASGNLQRAATNTDSVNEVPPIVHEVLRSPGQPLDAATRDYFEPRFSHDFSRVRVHTDVRAAESARAVNAQAYTVGRDVVFGAGQYEPQTSEGRRLLAHELTHNIQQGEGLNNSSLAIGSSDTAHEREADRMAGALTGGGHVGTGFTQTQPLIQRQELQPPGAKKETKPAEGKEAGKPKKICGPDVTAALIQLMKMNAKSEAVRMMRTLYSSSNLISKAKAVEMWYDLVKTGAPWDFKTFLGKPISDIAPCRQNCSGKIWSVTLAGRCMTYEAPGNIHYGYVGRWAGFEESFLLAGGAVAQIVEFRGESKDDPRDVEGVKKGIELFNAGDPGGLTSAGLTKNYFENLGSKDGDLAGCEPCTSKWPK